MADCCYSCYKIVGERCGEFWALLLGMGVADGGVDCDEVSVKDLLDGAGVECDVVHARGAVVWADFSLGVLTLGVESAWVGCHEAIDAVARGVYGLSVSWREEEISNGYVAAHDEGGFFGEQCVVSASDGFGLEDEVTYFVSVDDAVACWCAATGCARGGRSVAEMLAVIEDWEYDSLDAFLNIYMVERR